MNILKKRNLAETSDDYYYAYKAALERKEESRNFYSLNNIIKFEFFTLVAGLVFMSYNNFFNHFSIELQDNVLTSNISLSKNSDLALVTQLKLAEVDTIIPVEIKEEISIKEQVLRLSKKININTTDMSLLVEIIKSQLNKPTIDIEEDKIIISKL